MHSRIESHSVSVNADFEPPKTFARGRVCVEPGCQTVLSQYNDALRCATHRNARDARFPCSPGQGKARRKMDNE